MNVKYLPKHRRSAVDPRLLVSLALLALCGTAAIRAIDYPSWWANVLKTSGGQPVPADDFAALNQGQLKNFALAACNEFKSRLSTVAGGAGSGILNLENQLTVLQNGQRVPRVTSETDNYAAATIGHVKALAKPFYDRLIELQVAKYHPWPASAGDNNAVANLGQAKHIFNYDFDGDTDEDGISDFAELTTHHTNPGNSDSDEDGLSDGDELFTRGTDPKVADSDGDGLTDAEELIAGTDPNDEDTDHDGTDDGTDQYPLDERRSRDVPTINYAAIDASSAVTDEPIQGLALGNELKLGFWYDNESSSAYGVGVWEAGQLSFYNYPKTYTEMRWDPEAMEEYEFTFSLEAIGVSAQGILAGTSTSSEGKSIFEYLFTSEPAFGFLNMDAECLGITPAGVIWGRFENQVVFPASWANPRPPGYYDYGHYSVSFPAVFIGIEEFPKLAYSTSDTHVTLSWDVGEFDPSIVAYSGGRAAGDYRAPAGPLDYSKLDHYPTEAVPVHELDAPDFQPPTRSVWTGGNSFETVFPPDPDSTSEVVAISDGARVAGTSLRVTELPDVAEGASSPHPFYGYSPDPADIYQSLPEDFRKQVRINEVLAGSAGGVLFLRAEVLEGPSPGTWTPRKIVLNGAELSVALFPPVAAQISSPQINDDALVAGLADDKAYVLLPGEIVTRDRAFEGTMRFPGGWAGISLKFERGNESYGPFKMDDPADTKIYDSLDDVFSEQEAAQYDADKNAPPIKKAVEQPVTFVREGNKIRYWTVFDTLGEVKLTVLKDNQLLGAFSHTLTDC
jgi:hypothetical protein